MRRRLAYPVVVLVVLALSAACGGHPGPSAAPSLPAETTRPAPSPTTAAPATAPTTGQPATRPPVPRAASRYVFPVAGNASYHPTHSGYPATDIFAACGAPVLAVTDGRILEVSRADLFDANGPLGPLNGGKFVSLLGDDGVRYYGSHLTDVVPGIEAGVRVRAGQRVGTVGKTGNANNVCHLHFGISPPCLQIRDWWIRRGVVWPALFLDSWRKQTNRAPVDEVSAWRRHHGCPKAP